MHPPLVILGYSEAAMLVRRIPPPAIGAIISIHGHREYGVEAESSHRLDLTFDDVEVPSGDDPLAVQRAIRRRRQAADLGRLEVAPSLTDAAAIIAFGEAIRDADGLVLCHCGGGMSRAPGAALLCLAVWRGEGCERECVTEVLRVRRGAVPHLGLVRYGDALLGRDGRLVDAVIAGRQ